MSTDVTGALLFTLFLGLFMTLFHLDPQSWRTTGALMLKPNEYDTVQILFLGILRTTTTTEQ